MSIKNSTYKGYIMDSPHERLKILRKQLDMTQERFGIPLGLNPANIRDLEAGKVRVSILHALAIENVYKLNNDWLLHGHGEMFPTGKPKIESFNHDNIELFCNIYETVMKLIKNINKKTEHKKVAKIIFLTYQAFIKEGWKNDKEFIRHYLELAVKMA